MGADGHALIDLLSEVSSFFFVLMRQHALGRTVPSHYNQQPFQTKPNQSQRTALAATAKPDFMGDLAIFCRRDLCWWLPAHLSQNSHSLPSTDVPSPAPARAAESAGSLAADDFPLPAAASPPPRGAAALARGSLNLALTNGSPASDYPWNFPLLPPKNCQNHIRVSGGFAHRAGGRTHGASRDVLNRSDGLLRY